MHRAGKEGEVGGVGTFAYESQCTECSSVAPARMSLIVARPGDDSSGRWVRERQLVPSL
jgi:hypothetical protein